MLPNSPYVREPAPLERPSPLAKLEIRVVPARSWGTAKDRIPPGQARYSTMTFGIVANVVTGTAGAVLTLRIAPRLSGLALAELILALAAAVLIAARGPARNRAGRISSRREERG